MHRGFVHIVVQWIDSAARIPTINNECGRAGCVPHGRNGKTPEGSSNAGLEICPSSLPDLDWVWRAFAPLDHFAILDESREG